MTGPVSDETGERRRISYLRSRWLLKLTRENNRAAATCNVSPSMYSITMNVPVLIDREIARPFVGFVTGVGVDMDRKGHRRMLQPKSAAFWSDWL